MPLKTPTSAEWTLHLFGKPRVTRGDEIHDQFDTKRAIYLLARLALSHRGAITRNEAAEFLWPDDFFDATRLRLRQELARLRRGLGPARDILDTDEDWVRLADQDLDIDVRRFERLFQEARQEADLSKREEAYKLASNLSREPFLAGYDEDWIQVERTRLLELRYAILVDLAGLQARRGDHVAALETAKQAVESDPLQEAGHLVVMQELGKLGHLSDALGQYQNLKRLLRDELSESPSAEAERVVNELRQPAPPVVEPRSVVSGLNFSVPAPTEPIYGREEMIVHLRRLLDAKDSTHRLVSLTGPGGIGKTRLANQVAVELQEAYEGRIGWISMVDISDPADMPAVLASTLGLTLTPNSDPMERVCALLPKEPVLLILDNLEQLIPGGIAHLRTLAEARTNLRLLMTSRVAPNLGGERSLSVGPLPIPNDQDTIEQPAMRVFLDPLLAEQGFREPNTEELTILRQITEKLEGIPLALQLASGRLRTVTAKDLLGPLDKRLDMVNRRSDAPERHRTIRAAIGGSFHALDEDLQKMMGRLSVFRGGWSQSAAAAVSEVEDSLPLLEKLLDYSLIRVDREDRGLRFRMLETIRDYVRESIPPEQLLEAQLRHADWVLSLAPQGSSRQVDVATLEHFKVIDADLDNLREAVRFSMESDLNRAVLLASRFGCYWSNRILMRESLAFYKQLFDHLDDLPITVDLAMASYWQALLLYIAQAYTPGDVGYEIAMRTADLCEKVGLRIEVALTFLYRSRTPFMAGEYEESLVLVEEADRRLKLIAEPGDRALSYQARAMVRFYQGRVLEAIENMEEAKSLLGPDSSPFHQVQSSMMLSYMFLETGDIPKGKEHAYRAMELAENYGVRQFIPMIQEVCGKVAWAEGNLDLATEWFNVSAASWDIFGNPYQFADQLHHLGRIQLEKKDPVEALKLIASAARIWEGKGMVSVVPCTLTSAAKAHLLLGNPDLAARFLGTVKGIKSPTRDSELVFEIAYVEAIETELRAALGEEKLAQIYGASPDLVPALREAFA